MTESPFTEKQIAILNAPLDPRFVSERTGGGNAKLKYIEGHDAIDQADRIFGFGNWSYRPLSCNQVVLLDPLTGEAVGVVYKAQVELTVNGCAPIVDVGSQPVATWNVEDYVMKQRQNAVKYGKATTLEGPFTSLEKYKARDAIVSAHEMAEKGSVTDALKRALRVFGEQFGNGLYGDGRVDVDDTLQVSPQPSNPNNSNTSAPRQQPAPRQLIPTIKLSDVGTQASIPALVDAAKKAKTRAFSIKVVNSDEEWLALLDLVGVAEFKGGGDIAKVNGKITEIESKAG